MSQFFVIGETLFGIPDLIVDFLKDNSFEASFISDVRDIPVNYRSDRITQYLITHEYDLVSDNGMWLLDIRIYEFNPRGTNSLVALGTTTSSSPTRTLVRSVLGRIITTPFFF
jgi:hypothetical protein